MIKRVSTVCAVAIAALAFTGVALGADSGNSGGQSKSQQLMQTYQNDAKQLRSIHQKTLKNDQKLSKEQSQFEDQLRGAIKKQGYDVNAGQKRMHAMIKKLQSGKLSKKQRKQVMQNFQQERQKMMTARSKAMAQPEIKKSGQKLQNDTIQAMKKQNPKTQQLIAEMRSVRTKLQKSQGKQSSQSGS